MSMSVFRLEAVQLCRNVQNMTMECANVHRIN